MKKITAGVIKFQREEYPKRKPLFETLAKGQQPEALFICCADSRVDPSLITSTDPGDLFVCRNAGNIVPPHMPLTDAMTASIEYAVAALRVPHIIVCGHSGCGAMKGAMDLGSLEALPHVKAWLTHSRAAAQIVDKATDPSTTEEQRLDLLIRANVVLQLTHLRTHPYVAAAVEAGESRLHGWVYDIGSGGVVTYDEESGDFAPLREETVGQA